MFARLYNLFNRGEEEKKIRGEQAIISTEDDDEFATKYTEMEAKFKPVDTIVKQQVEALNANNALTNVENSIAFSEVASYETAPYSVHSEQAIQDRIHNIINVLQTKTDIDFSKPQEALDKLDADLWDTNKTAENSYWGVVSKELGINPRSTVVAIPPEIFNNMVGRGDTVTGGWYDANCYAPKVRELWLKQGVSFQFDKPMASQLQGNYVALYGEDSAKQLIEQARKKRNYHFNILRKKYGSKLVVGLYVLFAAWGLTWRLNALNWKDFMYQRAKFAERMAELDELDVLTPQSKHVYEAHAKWLSTYYEDEE
ncbi:hypothetical protein ABK040_002881 [Willaertia magna]